MAVTVEARPAERTARGGEPLAARRILGASFRIYLHRWRPHLAASIIAQGPVLVPTLVVVERLVDVVRNADFQSGDALVPIGGLTMVLLVLAFTSAFLFVLMSGAACQLVELWLQGREVRVIAAYAVAVRRFWRLAGAMLVVCAGLCAGLAALIGVLWFAYLGSLAVLQVDPSEAAADGRVLIILLGLASLAIVGVTALLIDAVVRWAVFVQVVMIEGAGPVAALLRSARLVRGRWRRTAWAMSALTLVPLVLMAVLSAVLGLALGPLASSGAVGSQVATDAALLAAQLALSPVAPIGVTVLFYALRDGETGVDRISRRLG